MKAFIFIMAILAMFKACTYVHAETFHIEPGELSYTLNEYSRQSDLQLLFDFNVVRGRSSGLIDCDCDRTEALTKMLDGSGLIFDFINDRTLAVTPEEERQAAFDSLGLTRSLSHFTYVAQSYGYDLKVRPKLEITSELPTQH